MFGISFITLDLIIILIAIAVFYVLGLKFGKKYLVSILLSLYPALLIFIHFPFIEAKGTYVEILLFVGTAVVISGIFNRVLSIGYGSSGLQAHLHLLLLSIANCILLLVIYTKYITGPLPYVFSGTITDFILETIPYGVTLMIPILVLLIAGRH